MLPIQSFNIRIPGSLQHSQTCDKKNETLSKRKKTDQFSLQIEKDFIFFKKYLKYLCVADIYAEPIYYGVKNIFQEWFIKLILETVFSSGHFYRYCNS